jgi:membrane protease YdiL (CAAX protease family)
MTRLYLIFEFALLFAALPLFLRFSPLRIPPLPVLWLAAGLCLLSLLRDPSFQRTQLWNPIPFGSNLPSILAFFTLGALLIGLATWRFTPGLLFNFVRSHPAFWALVMLLYPWLSVYPQGIIYRAFLMHRYQQLFPTPLAMLLVGAAAFALMHVIFRNPLAIGLTFIGGFLFAWRYQRTGSLFVSCFEHSLYGCFLFTIGLGRYFYALTT